MKLDRGEIIINKISAFKLIRIENFNLNSAKLSNNYLIGKVRMCELGKEPQNLNK
jgi:hypothetical protein